MHPVYVADVPSRDVSVETVTNKHLTERRQSGNIYPVEVAFFTEDVRHSSNEFTKLL